MIKAAKPRKLYPREIEIWPDANGEHYAVILDQPTPNFMDHDYDFSPDVLLQHAPPTDVLDGQVARISISHDDEHAFAVALVTDVPGP